MGDLDRLRDEAWPLLRLDLLLARTGFSSAESSSTTISSGSASASSSLIETTGTLAFFSEVFKSLGFSDEVPSIIFSESLATSGAFSLAALALLLSSFSSTVLANFLPV